MNIDHLLTRITADVANIRRAADGNHGWAGEPTDLMAALSWRMGVMLAAARRIGSHAETLREQFAIEQQRAEALATELEATTTSVPHG